MDIVEVARKSGQRASALRYYEERGLIASVGRNGLRRTFEPVVLKRLALIALARSAGFSLGEIGGLIGPNGMDREQLLAKAKDLDGKIKKLRNMRDQLRQAAACPQTSHFICPNFQARIEGGL